MFDKIDNFFLIFDYILFSRCKWVKVDGYEYKLRTGVILDVEDDFPIVGIIQGIHVGCNNKVILTVQQFSTIYIPHYRVYVVQLVQKLCVTVTCLFQSQFIFVLLTYMNSQILL